jgi:hypothetical protein
VHATYMPLTFLARICNLGNEGFQQDLETNSAHDVEVATLISSCLKFLAMVSRCGN